MAGAVAATLVSVTDPATLAYYTAADAYHTAHTTWIGVQTSRQTAVDAAAATQIGALTAQWGYYYDQADDAIDKRDIAIDTQISFMQYLQDTKVNTDLPMVQDQLDVLTDLDLPDVLTCGSGNDVAFQTWQDGIAVDDTANKLTDQAPGGRPNTFREHSGRLYGMKSGSYAYGIVSNADVRRRERFRKNKTQLVRQAQSNSKSIYSAGEVLSKYAQNTAIYSGLADLYIQGFNSAGAGLGVALGRLGTGTKDGGGNSSNPAGLGNSQTGPLGPPSS